MPTYTFECTTADCEVAGLPVEKDRPVTSIDDPVPCNACGQPMKRIISGGLAIRFVGRGFYINDSKNGP